MLDYFVVDVKLARAVKEVRVKEEVAFHPHRPVELILAERPADLAYVDFDTPPQIPKVKRIGPIGRRKMHLAGIRTRSTRDHGGSGWSGRGDEAGQAVHDVPQLRQKSGNRLSGPHG